MKDGELVLSLLSVGTLILLNGKAINGMGGQLNQLQLGVTLEILNLIKNKSMDLGKLYKTIVKDSLDIATTLIKKQQEEIIELKRVEVY